MKKAQAISVLTPFLLFGIAIFVNYFTTTSSWISFINWLYSLLGKKNASTNDIISASAFFATIANISSFIPIIIQTMKANRRLWKKHEIERQYLEMLRDMGSIWTVPNLVNLTPIRQSRSNRRNWNGRNPASGARLNGTLALENAGTVWIASLRSWRKPVKWWFMPASCTWTCGRGSGFFCDSFSAGSEIRFRTGRKERLLHLPEKWHLCRWH